ncbi:hypothetical protein M413DRAFT_14660 [Hebeloma cylindrosporum]|uniref:Uncharacterized protein n=1 Tax=Hebeloma cylindrosporum TaxID=76867 RepID=A0A0C3BT46_HEBCY|nr:hypothetical protein M413DRAFT_14660 [Hebeloma cylindrosporum h7]
MTKSLLIQEYWAICDCGIFPGGRKHASQDVTITALVGGTSCDDSTGFESCALLEAIENDKRGLEKKGDRQSTMPDPHRAYGSGETNRQFLSAFTHKREVPIDRLLTKKAKDGDLVGGRIHRGERHVRVATERHLVRISVAGDCGVYGAAGEAGDKKEAVGGMTRHPQR